MIKRLLDQIVDAISTLDSAENELEGRADAIRKATAVLMLDVALADKVFDRSELEKVLELAEVHFGLRREEAAELIDGARNEAEAIVSLNQFTQLLHKYLDDEEKASIIAMLWQIAYADGRLDKYENALVLKISDLLYVSRGRVMRLKHDAEQKSGDKEQK